MRGRPCRDMGCRMQQQQQQQQLQQIGSGNYNYFTATNNDMVVPRSRLKFGERAFSIAAPRAWNSNLLICASH